MSRSISLEMEWIPRSENEKSDYLSRIIDFDDWGISFNSLSIKQSRFGNLHIDWFASEHNAKLPKFIQDFGIQSAEVLMHLQNSGVTSFDCLYPIFQSYIGL